MMMMMIFRGFWNRLLNEFLTLKTIENIYWLCFSVGLLATILWTVIMQLPIPWSTSWENPLSWSHLMATRLNVSKPCRNLTLIMRWLVSQYSAVPSPPLRPPPPHGGLINNVQGLFTSTLKPLSRLQVARLIRSKFRPLDADTEGGRFKLKMAARDSGNY